MNDVASWAATLLAPLIPAPRLRSPSSRPAASPAQEPALRLRPLAREDVVDLAALWRRARFHALPGFEARQGHSPADDLAFFFDEIAARTEVVVAESLESPPRLLGFLALTSTHLDRLYVDPSAQGQGVGSALLAEAKRQRPEGLDLFTLQINTRARAFYEGRGFTAIAFGTSPPPENEPDVTYRWQPTPEAGSRPRETQGDSPEREARGFASGWTTRQLGERND